ncbi:MAG: hypothetical protein KAU62_01485 [Candidatus Heimdallarchaeota archaeon]|nr:hypothetical protein [Candidatus Heimdallarchaeota archaeon]MCK4609807.1 hypothetical protein [Candidatus Heimdallarchaeota archaeon]
MRSFTNDELESKALSISSKGSFSRIGSFGRSPFFRFIGPFNDSSLLDFSSLSSDFLRTVSQITIRYVPIDFLDLSPLKDCKHLQFLDIQYTNFKALDLCPLQNTPLERLILTHNLFTELDLSPLTSCSNLKNLNIAGNDLAHIDLRQLGQNFNLRSLSVGGNSFRDLDLSPLERLDLDVFSFPSFLPLDPFDLSPLKNHHLHTLVYSLEDGDSSELKPLINDSRCIGYSKEEHYYTPDSSGFINSRCEYRGVRNIMEFSIGEETRDTQILEVSNVVYKKKED